MARPLGFPASRTPPANGPGIDVPGSPVVSTTDHDPAMSPEEPTRGNVSLGRSAAQLDHLRNHLTGSIEDQVAAATADGAVGALSRGVDSSRTAYSAVEVLGPDRVPGLIRPGEMSQRDDLPDAERVAEQLEMDAELIAIGPIGHCRQGTYPDAADDRVAMANVRPVPNYLAANHDNAVLLGAGNRTELPTGYFPQFGDGAVDCLSIENPNHQQVRQLARYVGLPAGIVEKPATAELWAGQSDEDELDPDYDTIDAILGRQITESIHECRSIRNASSWEASRALALGESLAVDETANLLDVTEGDVRRRSRLHTASSPKFEMPPSPDPHLPANGS